MNMKKSLASAMAAVCVLGTGILPSVSVSAADEWLDVSLRPKSYFVKAGDYLNIDVVVKDLGKNYQIGGMQVKMKTYSTEAPKLNAISSYHELAANVDTGEAAFTIKPDVSGDALVTYQYIIPDDAKAGTNYSFDIQSAFTFACDTDGKEIPLEFMPTYLLVTVADNEQKDISIYQTMSQYEVKPGDSFDVDIVIDGKDAASVSGFQFKIDMPEGIECLGLAKETTDNGADIHFNPDTLEVAMADQKGASAGFSSGEKVATVKFRVPENFQEGDYTLGITDACASDSNGEQSAPVVNSASKLVVAVDVPVLNGKLGDANLDGKVDAKDASLVLAEYSLLSTGAEGTFEDQQFKNGDVNFDSKIDAKDASKILAYYSYLSTGGSDIMEEWVKTN